MSDKVFVGGISWDTDEEALAAAFGQFGEVVSTKIVMDRDTGRSRGFGFVQYAQPSMAQEAIDSGNGLMLDGRSLRVSEAQERKGDGGGGGGNRRFNGGGGGGRGGRGGRSGGRDGGGRDRY